MGRKNERSISAIRKHLGSDVEVRDIGDGWVRVDGPDSSYIDGHADSAWTVVRGDAVVMTGSCAAAAEAFTALAKPVEPAKEPVAVKVKSKPAKKTKAGKEKK